MQGPRQGDPGRPAWPPAGGRRRGHDGAGDRRDGEGGSHRERFDAVKLILSELAEAKKPAERCTCESAPGQYCNQLEPHGYRSVPKHVGLEDVLRLAVETGLVTGENIRIAGEPVKKGALPSPSEEKSVDLSSWVP